jgi:hypothetical protein
MKVDSQSERALCYRLYQSALLKLRFVVGSSYFMWTDDPAEGVARAFPEDCNYGLVNDRDQPYSELVAAATKINKEATEIHAGEESADAPRLSVPYQAQAGDPAAPRLARTTSGFEVVTKKLRFVKDAPDGFAFNHIFFRKDDADPWTELGSYIPIVAETQDGRPNFARPTRVSSIETSNTEGVLNLTLTFDRDKLPGDPAVPYRCQVEFRILPSSNYYCVRMLWIENTGSSPLAAKSYLHYARSAFRGSPDSDKPVGAPVENYWLNVSAWEDPDADLRYGVLEDPQDKRLRIHYWLDVPGNEHPDCVRELQETIAPAQKWEPVQPEPWATFFGSTINGSVYDPVSAGSSHD